MSFGHVVVTGASAGIGEAIARELGRAGASLTLVARRKEKLDALARELGGKTHIVQADLSDTARCCDWIAAAEAALGPIEVLVNNAGAQIVGDLVTCDPEKGEEMMRLDLFTPMREQMQSRTQEFDLSICLRKPIAFVTIDVALRRQCFE